MTNLDRLVPTFPGFIGFDHLLSDFANKTKDNYPPYNIYTEENGDYVLELAVAGFDKENLNVEVKSDHITITGDNKNKNNNGRQYYHKGIGTRMFSKTFSLAKDVVVDKAKMDNGILKIYFKKLVPEDNKNSYLPIE